MKSKAERERAMVLESVRRTGIPATLAGEPERLAEFRAGDRVMTPSGAGVVVNRRMAPPDYSRVESYSVKLDGREHAGAVFAAGDVKADL